jgi:hypothetical protein
MASLYASLSLALVRLIIIKFNDNTWLEVNSFKSKIPMLIIWPLTLTFSIPPLIGFGYYDQSMVGVR